MPSKNLNMILNKFKKMFDRLVSSRHMVPEDGLL